MCLNFELSRQKTMEIKIYFYVSDDVRYVSDDVRYVSDDVNHYLLIIHVSPKFEGFLYRTHCTGSKPRPPPPLW